MAAKKLEDQSKYDAYDMDGDGIVSDSEMAKAKEIRETAQTLSSTSYGPMDSDWYGCVYSYNVLYTSGPRHGTERYF
jgi:hypothetical protein